MKHLGAVFFAALVMSACGDDESSLVGIWEVTAWSENPTACDTPGTSVLGSRGQPYFAVLDQNFFGQRFLSALQCGDLEECRALLDDTETLHLGTYTFESGSDEDGWTGTITFAFTGDDGLCAGEVAQHTMRADGEALVLDTISTSVSGYPPDDDGFCDTDEAQELAADAPCSGREMVTAARVE